MARSARSIGESAFNTHKSCTPRSLWPHEGATSTTPATPNNSTPKPTLCFLSPVHCDSIVETEPLFGSSPRACILNKIYSVQVCTSTYVYVRIIKNQKQKPLSVSLAPVGKSVSFSGFEFFEERAMWMCNIVLLLIWIRRISDWVGQSMYGKYSGHRFYSQNRALRLLLVCPHTRMDVHMNIYYPVTFFDILGILSASCVPLSLSETPYAAPGFFMLSVRYQQILAS